MHSANFGAVREDNELDRGQLGERMSVDGVVHDYILRIGIDNGIILGQMNISDSLIAALRKGLLMVVSIQDYILFFNEILSNIAMMFHLEDHHQSLLNSCQSDCILQTFYLPDHFFLAFSFSACLY